MAKIQSVEPNIADLANGWMKSYKLELQHSVYRERLLHLKVTAPFPYLSGDFLRLDLRQVLPGTAPRRSWRSLPALPDSKMHP